MLLLSLLRSAPQPTVAAHLASRAPLSPPSSDHESEEGAARAFDRAAINKAGRAAVLNFPLDEYEAEVDDLQRMALPDLVAALRSKVRHWLVLLARAGGNGCVCAL